MSVPIAPEVSRLPTDPDQHWPVGSALLSARLLVERGWLQGAFLAVTGPAGQWHEVGPLDLGWYRPGDVVAGCLLGAVAYGSWGGDGRSRRLVHRMAVDHAWTVWARDGARVVPERLRFGPADRALRLQDLTAWNDAPGRTADEVSDLLAEAALTSTPERVQS